MEIRKIKESEFNQVIELAGNWFSYNNRSFDFKKIQPKMYDTNLGVDYTYVAIINQEIVGIISIFPFSYLNLKFVSIGTVCVNHKYRHQGILKALFDYLDNEVLPNYDVATLSGQKIRYERFGFYKTGLKKIYHILTKNIASTKDVTIALATKEDNSLLSELYNKTESIIKRDTNIFYHSLISRGSDVYLLKTNNEIIGYLVYNTEKNQIFEVIVDDDYYLSSLLEFALKNDQSSISVVTSLTDSKNDLLDTISDSTELSMLINIKLLNLNLINTLINQKTIKEHFKLIIEVNNQRYMFSKKSKQIAVSYTKETPNLIFSIRDFYNLLFGDFVIRKDFGIYNPIVKQMFPIILKSSLGTIDKI